MKKAVLMLSGGPDSSTLAYLLKSQDYELHTITFNFGEQEGEAEQRYAQVIANKVSKTHRFVDFVNPMKQLYGFFDIPDPIHILRKTANPREPIKNFGAGIALSLASSYAADIGADELFYAVHKDDAVYRENNIGFFETMSKAISIELGREFKIKAPLLNKTKAEVFRLAIDLGLKIEETWSCASNSVIQCGTCDPCKDRRLALMENNIDDLTVYKNPSNIYIHS
ncbi:7-cyano-7-deazaguanine synthase [Paenibacillus sp. YPG26]|uniref:7-cyano-7-deazaguanine synthase n=1 Tax=Paenibacillus sp. YPG26 TaxID=2878915 RepID=UPI00203BD8F8|nr:7-cyano-7-deazaguanine synthase [Paenibacillus sp. YPG26]USB32172.1 7-cyano-7-deazaguanine synthase [Paenibacillus sp. YPG26]